MCAFGNVQLSDLMPGFAGPAFSLGSGGIKPLSGCQANRFSHTLLPFFFSNSRVLPPGLTRRVPEKCRGCVVPTGVGDRRRPGTPGQKQTCLDSFAGLRLKPPTRWPPGFELSDDRRLRCDLSDSLIAHIFYCLTKPCLSILSLFPQWTAIKADIPSDSLD